MSVPNTPTIVYSDEAGPSTHQSKSVNASPIHAFSGQVPSPHSPRLGAASSRLVELLRPGRSRSGSTASVDTASGVEEMDIQSGRSTPEQRRRTGRAAASLLANDARYKKFATQVDRALQSFESVNEWADFISFLSRLLKTLQSPQPPFHEIPRKLIVSKRLAQCLNPALPSGVHQRTLEVYAHIFSTIGVEGLRRDLLTWSSGLFPFFQFATTSVRPHLLNIYETYYLPLGSDLRPATKAMMLALLPGMEEETGDFFERVLALLTHLSTAVDDNFFLHNVLLVLISSASARLPALHYLSRRVLKPPDELQSGLLLRGIAAVLADDNVLVRRNGLDMLLRIMRMDGDIYKLAEDKDKDLLLRAAFDVVLQRDISLSRRVYNWLLGTGETSEQQVEYFQHNGLEAISAALQFDMEQDPTSPRPFRTFLALLDKWEVGSLLAEKLVMPAFKAIYIANLTADGESRVELGSTANAVYDGVEPFIIWKQIYALLKKEKEDDLNLVHWLLETLSRHEEEVIKVYIPALLELRLQVETLLRLIPISHFRSAPSESQNSDPIAEKIFDKVITLEEGVKAVRAETIPSILRTIFYLCQSGAMRNTPDFLIILRMASSLVESEPVVSFDLTAWMNALSSRMKKAPFEVVEAVASLILKTARSPIVQPETGMTESILENAMISLLRFLRADQTRHHTRASELLWEFKSHAGPYVLEDTLCQRMRSQDRFGAYEEFGTLWRLTDDVMLPGDIFFTPIMIILDGIKNDDPTLRRVCEIWLKVNLGHFTRLFDPTICRLLNESDIGVTTHLVRCLATIFKFGGQGISEACRISRPNDSPYPLITAQSVSSYTELISKMLVKLLESPPVKGATQFKLLLKLHDSILELMQLQITLGGLDPGTLRQYQSAILDKAEESVRLAELDLQAKLLHLINTTLTDKPKKSVLEKTSDIDGRIVTLVQSALSGRRIVPVLRHWVDFVLESAPYFRRDLLESLSGTLTAQVRRLLTESLELEIIMLLEGVARVAMILLPNKKDRRSEDSTRTGEGGSSILGYMSGVFTVEGPIQDLKSDNTLWLDDAVHALLAVWSSAQLPLRSRTRIVLEEMFRSQPTAVFGSIVRVWALNSSEISDKAIFDSIDTHTTSAQKVVGMIGDHLKSVKGELAVDPIYTGLLEAYIHRLEAPIAVQVWSSAFGLAKDLSISATTPIAKAQLYPILRCLTALGKIVATTSALEDKRLRRDLLDTYAKLLDNVVVNLPKLGEVEFWTRGNGAENVNSFIASELVPNLRDLLVENDRIAVACSSIATGVLIPAFRQQKVDSSILEIISEMTHLHGAARSWRPLIGDAFNDSKFFRMTPIESHTWQPLISSMMDSDKDRFIELLSRIQAGPSSNIFINRESEMISRSLNLRRLSFVLLAADNNHYLTQLPSIQEKLVDILRNDVVSPQVHSEVYLCLRVLMTRISAQHMSNFWPVILAELLKVFEGTMEDPPLDGDEGLLLVLAACKFLDLLLLMQSEDFQIHQWMFVTDTTDAAFPLEGYEPEAIMDRLNEILAEHSHLRSQQIQLDVVSWEEQVGPRRPRLGSVRKLGSLSQLQPFFARASIDTFEGVYSGQGVDWERVEEGLNEEIFEAT